MNIWEKGQYKEIWIYPEETEDDERAMVGLINKDWGWLIKEHFADRGLIAVTAKAGNSVWPTSLLPMGDGTHSNLIVPLVRVSCNAWFE